MTEASTADDPSADEAAATVGPGPSTGAVTTWLLARAGLTSRHDLAGLTRLELADCGLTSLPEALPVLLPNLAILFCPKNRFEEVPDLIGRCPALNMVSFRECRTIRSVSPDALQPQLRWLILTGNAIEELPETIGRCKPRLQKLMLSGNRLASLPSAMADLHNLELVRLACNQLRDVPSHLLGLENLRWAAFSGNPFLTKAAAAGTTTTGPAVVVDDDGAAGREEETPTPPVSSLPILDDPALDDTSCRVLGSGAGGVTRQVTYGDGDVAVKTFVGELTSDGSPQDEKAISVLASSLNDPALIRLLGETRGGGALVMELLVGYEALAGPPSMDSCSRDVYDTDRTRLLSPAFCWKIAMDMLRVLWKLHGLGICHGDFYAHNILINIVTKSVKLSDFGAAYLYDPSDRAGCGHLIPRIELRSYAVLVEELEGLVLQNQAAAATANDDDDDDPTTTTAEPWRELLAACERPDSTFEALVRQFGSEWR